MRNAKFYKVGNLRATRLLAVIVVGAVLQLSNPSQAEPILSNSYFVVVGDEQRFEAHFSEDGHLFIFGDFGEHQGFWEIVGTHLCVEFADGPRDCRRSEPLTCTDPHSVKVGDHLFLARLAKAIRWSLP